MSAHVQTRIDKHLGIITLDRPKALNSLSLDMIRFLTQTLLTWRDDANIRAVFIHGSEERAFCAGGDIRFFHTCGHATPQGDSALLEDFFTEEYALNHLIHTYPKPYIAWMNGIVMGGGMGIAQAGPDCRMRIVTEKTKMAMPEVNIGLFPDVGGSYFLSRCPGELGTWLGLTGETITAADALYAELADCYLPSHMLDDLLRMLANSDARDLRQVVRDFAAPYAQQAIPEQSNLAQVRNLIDTLFDGNNLAKIVNGLREYSEEFAQQTLALMDKRSPLMMAVTLEQLRRGATMTVADCLRMERDMVRYSFKQGEVLEGVRALVIDKDNAPRWSVASADEVTAERVSAFFASPWPAYVHPLRDLM